MINDLKEMELVEQELLKTRMKIVQSIRQEIADEKSDFKRVENDSGCLIGTIRLSQLTETLDLNPGVYIPEIQAEAVGTRLEKCQTTISFVNEIKRMIETRRAETKNYGLVYLNDQTLEILKMAINKQ